MLKQLKGPHTPQKRTANRDDARIQDAGFEGTDARVQGECSPLQPANTHSSPLSIAGSGAISGRGNVTRSPSALDMLREQRQLHNQNKVPNYQCHWASQSPTSSPAHSPYNDKKGEQERGQHKSSSTCVDKKREVGIGQKEKGKSATSQPAKGARPNSQRTSRHRRTQSAPRSSDFEASLMDITPPDFETDSESEPQEASKMSETVATVRSSKESSLDASEAATPRVLTLSEDSSNDVAGPSQNIVVCVRVRNVQKLAGPSMWTLEPNMQRIAPTQHHPTMAKRTTAASEAAAASCEEGGAYNFQFDSLVSPQQTADYMYEAKIAPVVNGVIKGYNGTVFAYGQTGSGKTYTMSGGGDEQGLIPRAIEQIFASVEDDADREYLLRVSYLEIYNENLHDLLAALPSSTSQTSNLCSSSRPSSPIKGGSSHVVSSSNTTSSSLRMFESGGRVQINGLREEIVTGAKDVLDLLERGQCARHQAATDWNERSSRSHCVFILTVESRDKRLTEAGESKEVRLSQLNLIDLAGSERAASEKARRKEGAFINKSLLTLGTVIAKLSEQCSAGKFDGRHIPYRDSKLTRLLQTSLSGNARVAVVCTISPRKEHAIESMSTLRFGQRCKMVVTHAKQGTIMDDKALIARYRLELEKLRAQLENASMQSNSIRTSGQEPHDDEQTFKTLKSRREEAEEEMRDMNEKRAELKRQVEHLTRLILTGKSVADEKTRKAVDRDDENAESEESESENAGKDPSLAKKQRIRNSRRSDVGPPSPVRRSRLFLNMQRPMTPLRLNSAENMPSSTAKPFALEAELAQTRKSLAQAIAAKQASEEARAKEQELWKTKVSDLEASIKEQGEELDEAELAYVKLREERDAHRASAEKEQESKHLLELVVKSRSEDADQRQDALKEHRDKIKVLSEQLEHANSRLQEVVQTGKDERVGLESQIASLKVEVSKASDRAAQSVREDIQRLQNDLDQSRQEATRLSQALAEATNGRRDEESRPRSDAEEMSALRRQLEDTIAAKDSILAELHFENIKHLEEDAERDLADLLREGEEKKVIAALRGKLQAATKRLAVREQELQDRLDELGRIKELDASTQLSKTTIEAHSALEERLRISDIRNAELEALVARLQEEKLAACHSQPASPLRNKGPGRLGAVAEAGDSSADLSADTSGPMLQAGPFAGSKALNRGGSMREFKSSPLRSGDDLSRSSNGGRASGAAAALECALKEEREETARLNEVIRTQRSIMSDLESSVAEWKQRLRSQQAIINQLVGSSSGTNGHSGGTQAEAAVDGTKQSSSTASLNANRSATATSPRTSEVKRTSSTTSQLNSPYYGAHLFNRPPPQSNLGLASHTSPTKGVGWSGARPDPLPLGESCTHNNASTVGTLTAATLTSSPSRLRRRKTIEDEIQSLKGSPRVESTKHRLLDPFAINSGATSASNLSSPQPQRSPAGNPRPCGPSHLAQTSPVRASRDYYI